MKSGVDDLREYWIRKEGVERRELSVGRREGIAAIEEGITKGMWLMILSRRMVMQSMKWVGEKEEILWMECAVINDCIHFKR